MKKKKLTNKEITEAIEGLDHNLQILLNKLLQMDSLHGLYLEYKKDTEKFNKFVKGKVKEFEQKQRSEITKGA